MSHWNDEGTRIAVARWGRKRGFNVPASLERDDDDDNVGDDSDGDDDALSAIKTRH